MISYDKIAKVLGLLLLISGVATAGDQRPLAQSPYNPDAKIVDLFSGMKDGTIAVKVVPRNAQGGKLFLTNQTKEPLTVKMPQGFVGIPHLAQFGQPGQGFTFGNSTQTGLNGNSSGNSANRGTQMVGGGTMSSNTTSGTGQQNGTNGTGNQFPNGFFSIPPERTLRVSYTSACLNHGLLEPTARTSMTLAPVEEVTSAPVLQDLLNRMGDRQFDQKTMQAAIWHVANGLSWQELAAKGNSPVPTPGDHYFSATQMKAAQDLVAELKAAHPDRTADQPQLANTPRTRLPVSNQVR